MTYTTQKAVYGSSRGYSTQTTYKATDQSERKKTAKYLGCTCGGHGSCRGTCRTLFTE